MNIFLISITCLTSMTITGSLITRHNILYEKNRHQRAGIDPLESKAYWSYALLFLGSASLILLLIGNFLIEFFDIRSYGSYDGSFAGWEYILAFLILYNAYKYLSAKLRFLKQTRLFYPLQTFTWLTIYSLTVFLLKLTPGLINAPEIIVTVTIVALYVIFGFRMFYLSMKDSHD